jgi:exopolysaccharide production protein ExoZ
MSHFGADVAWDDIFGARRVDLFFVISGFIMAYTTRRFEPGGNRPAQAWSFLVQRFFRVVPLYWIALTLACREFFLNGTADAGVLRDFLFMPRFNPVAPEHIWPWLMPGWTLNYEVFFYIVFAASMLLGRWRKAAVALAFGSLVLAGLVVAPSSAPAVFYTSTVLLEFALGLGVYSVMRSGVGAQRPLVMCAALVVGSTVLVFDSAPDALRGFTAGPAAALVVWSAALLFRGVRNGPLLRIGEAAYCIYLFHGFSFAFTSRLCKFLSLTEPTRVNIVIVESVMVGGAIVCGLALHRWLERPLLNFTRQFVPGAGAVRPAASIAGRPAISRRPAFRRCWDAITRNYRRSEVAGLQFGDPLPSVFSPVQRRAPVADLSEKVTPALPRKSSNAQRTP